MSNLDKNQIRELMKTKTPTQIIIELRLNDKNSFESFQALLKEIKQEDKGLKDASKLVRENSPNDIISQNTKILNQQIKELNSFSQEINKGNDYNLSNLAQLQILEEAYEQLGIIQEGVQEILNSKSNKLNANKQKLEKMKELLSELKLSPNELVNQLCSEADEIIEYIENYQRQQTL